MIIVCPACSIKYAVDAKDIPFAGRKVECSRCGWVWHAGGATGDADGRETPAPARERGPEPATAAARPKDSQPARPATETRFALTAESGGDGARAGDMPQPRLSFDTPAADAESGLPRLADDAVESSNPPPLPAQNDGRHVRLDERRGGGSALMWFAGSAIVALALAGGFIYQAEILAWMKSLGQMLPSGF